MTPLVLSQCLSMCSAIGVGILIVYLLDYRKTKSHEYLAVFVIWSILSLIGVGFSALVCYWTGMEIRW